MSSNFLKVITRIDSVKLSETLSFLSGTSSSGSNKNLLEISEHDAQEDTWSNTTWDWDDHMDVMEHNENNPEAKQSSSFSQYLITVSPTGSSLAFAYGKNIAIFESSDSEILEVSWKAELQLDVDEDITSILFIPIASQRKSSLIDWTCLVVGLSSGYIRVYSRDVLLFSQLLHIGPVLNIKCRTADPLKGTGAGRDKVDELTVLFPKALVSIDGFSFVQSIRACRNQIARSTAMGMDRVQPPPLAYKKWSLHNQDHIVDHASCGLLKPNTWDEMALVSNQSFGTPLRSSSAAASLYITTGVRPFLGFFYGVEGSAQLMFSEVALSVASKLTSALFSAAGGIFGLSRKPDVNDPPEKKVEPAAPLSMRFGLPDRRRAGETLIVSPNDDLAATLDSFGRVMLIDVHKGIVVRIWKGYRDAQIAFYRQHDTDRVRCAQFLVIYVPRRGLLEVWLVEHGPRVASFQVEGNCIMLPISHGILGMTAVADVTLLQCAMVSNDGVIHTLELPFHLSLCDKTNSRAQGLVLLKEVQSLLTEEQLGAHVMKEITNRVRAIKVASVRQQALETVLSCRHLRSEQCSELLEVIKDAISAHQSKAEHSELGVEETRLKLYCNAQLMLIELYDKIYSLPNTICIEDEPDDLAQAAGDTVKLLRLSDELTLSLAATLSLVRNSLTSPSLVSEPLSLSDFLSSFDYKSPHTEQQKDPEIFIADSLADEQKVQLEQFLFARSLDDPESAKRLCPILIKSKLSADKLCTIMLSCWLSWKYRKLESVRSLYCLMKTLISMAGDEERLIVDASETSPWWQCVRLLCSKSHNIASALLAVATCRSVAISHKTNVEMHDDLQDIVDWDVLSIESESWDVLLNQLHDLVFLELLLSLPSGEDKKNEDFDPLVVSLHTILESGRGVIPELIGKVMVNRDYSVDDILIPDVCALPSSPTESSSFPKLLERLLAKFPLSLNPDIILANCAWEYVVVWFKSTNDLNKLKHAVELLAKIRTPALQHGICVTLWDTFISTVTTSCDKLFEKVGKAPKERVCRKETGLSDKGVEQFLQLLCKFFHVLMSANGRFVGEKPCLDIEDLWQEAASPRSLADVACRCDSTNYHLLKHHLHLFTAMLAVISFQMKSIRPRSLFDAKENRAFLQNLVSYPYYPNENTDIPIITARRQFWTRVVTECVRLLCDERTELSEGTLLEWVANTKLIGAEMSVSEDELQRHFVAELFNYGLDQLGLKEIEHVDDKCVLSSQAPIAHLPKSAIYKSQNFPPIFLVHGRSQGGPRVPGPPKA